MSDLLRIHVEGKDVARLASSVENVLEGEPMELVYASLLTILILNANPQLRDQALVNAVENASNAIAMIANSAPSSPTTTVN